MTEQTTENQAILIELAQLAIDAEREERAAKYVKDVYSDACRDHKMSNGGEYIHRDTPEWEAMMEVTKAEYAASQAARKKFYAAKKNLNAAITKFRGYDEIDQMNSRRHDANLDRLIGDDEDEIDLIPF